MIFGLFTRMHLVEQVGSGINRMNDLMKAAGLSKPTYNTEGMFVIRLKRGVVDVDKLGDKLGDKADSRDKILKYIIENKDITITELAALLGITYKGVQYHIAALQKAGILTRTGSRKSGHWVVLD